MIRVFLVDDHEIVRRGVAELINAEADLEVVGEAGTARSAIGRIAATLPDVAVLDVRLPDGSGIEVCRSIRSAHPSVHCLMLTAYDDDEASYMAVLAGASGYVLKDIRGQSLLSSIRRAALGEAMVNPGVAKTVATRVHESLEPALSQREQQILLLITEGMTNRQIGEQLDLAEKTVKNYVSSLFAKLGIQRRTQAAVYGARLAQQ